MQRRAPRAARIPTTSLDVLALDSLPLGAAALPPPGEYEARFVPCLPTASIDADQFTFRFDHRINDRQNLSLYYYFNDERDLQSFLYVPGLGRERSRPRDQGEKSQSAMESQPHLDDQQFVGE